MSRSFHETPSPIASRAWCSHNSPSPLAFEGLCTPEADRTPSLTLRVGVFGKITLTRSVSEGIFRSGVQSPSKTRGEWAHPTSEGEEDSRHQLECGCDSGPAPAL